MIVSFFDGELCAIRGLAPGPHAAPWAVRLHEAPAPSRYPTPKHRNLYPHPLPPEWMITDDLLSGAPAVEAVAGWSSATGGEAGRLLDTLGLGEQVELWYPCRTRPSHRRWTRWSRP